MGFLPTNYEPPASGGNYMKMVAGKNKVRVLTPAVVGNVFWTGQGENRKPVRRRCGEEIGAHELGIDTHGQKEKVKHFWAFAVWNYHANAVQILEVTQATVRDVVQALCEDSDWGDPMGYDISITKTGTGLDTTYAVTPSNKAPTPKNILDALDANRPNLDALFSGADPFNAATTPPARAAVPIRAAGDARKAAFTAWRTLQPANANRERLGEAWAAAVANAYPGRKQIELTADEWVRFGEALQVPEYAGEESDPLPF